MAGGTDAGVVDQHIDAAEVAQRRSRHRLAVGANGDVGANRLDDAVGRADLLGQFGQQRLGTRRRQHARTALRRRLR